jgi:choline dehydrogenase
MVGTCKMGVDPQAVVDPELRVRGLGGLRVIDSSIFPTIPSSNTNIPTIAAAEKGSDLLLMEKKH